MQNHAGTKSSEAKSGATAAHPSAQERGKASYYSKRATGARSASGAVIHHDSLTCAHRSYPFGTQLLVTNLANHRQVIVTVTDRGPFRRGRIIDISYAAARELGMLAQGIGTVEIEPYHAPDKVPFLPAPYEMPQITFSVAENFVSDMTLNFDK